MKKLVIPLYIPYYDEKVDYESLENIVKDIENSIILIGDCGLNNLNKSDYINVYLFLKIINSKNEYYTEKNYDDALIDAYKNKESHIITPLGNVLHNEINEYLLNQELGVSDNSLNKYLKIFKNIIEKNEKENIKYILLKKKKISCYKNLEIDNLLGISEI